MHVVPAPRPTVLSTYLTASKVAIDLRTCHGGNVLAAAQAADFLLGATPTGPGQSQRWRGVIARASLLIARGLIGQRPDWGRLPF